MSAARRKEASQQILERPFGPHELGAAEAQGYVRLKSWEQGGTHFATLTFPGLPVPFEPTAAITARWLESVAHDSVTWLKAVPQSAGGCHRSGNVGGR